MLRELDMISEKPGVLAQLRRSTRRFWRIAERYLAESQENARYYAEERETKMAE